MINQKNSFIRCGIKYNDDSSEIKCPTSYEYGDEISLFTNKENYINLK